MRKESSEKIAVETARRRLDQLRRELSAAGLEPRSLAELEPPSAADHEVAPVGSDQRVSRAPRPDPPESPARVAGPGRHLRRSDARVARAAGWIDDRLPATLRGRVRLGARELGLLVVLAAAALVVAAVTVLRSGSGGAAVPLARPVAGPASPLVPATGGDLASPMMPAGSPTGPPGSRRVTVDVSGKVRHPGVVTLPAGARVIDALHKAGGARGRVDLTALNLARVLSDGEQIVVGAPAVPGVAASAAAGQPAGGALVDLNSATEEQLESLPGVGPVTAQKILAWRSAHGAFSSVDELLEVDGIGEKTLADLAPHVTL